ncbi:MAG: hypothetical protein DRI44_09705 [Chlamydiae bacterium]|nr:MAG: hypothetical protein DRI44_09705 [Chlamydiota bacterium]
MFMEINMPIGLIFFRLVIILFIPLIIFMTLIMKLLRSLSHIVILEISNGENSIMLNIELRSRWKELNLSTAAYSNPKVRKNLLKSITIKFPEEFETLSGEKIGKISLRPSETITVYDKISKSTYKITLSNIIRRKK